MILSDDEKLIWSAAYAQAYIQIQGNVSNSLRVDLALSQANDCILSLREVTAQRMFHHESLDE
jgi:hypothetical protein